MRVKKSTLKTIGSRIQCTKSLKYVGSNLSKKHIINLAYLSSFYNLK